MAHISTSGSGRPTRHWRPNRRENTEKLHKGGDSVPHRQYRNAFRLPFTSVFILRAAVTKYHTLGSLSNRNVSFPQYGGWKSNIKVSAGLVPLRGVREKGFQPSRLAFGSLRHSLASLCTCLCVLISPFIMPTTNWQLPSTSTRIKS